jgi:hypothetical protein
MGARTLKQAERDRLRGMIIFNFCSRSLDPQVFSFVSRNKTVLDFRSLITAPDKAFFTVSIITFNYAAMPHRKKGGVPELPFETARERDLYQ